MNKPLSITILFIALFTTIIACSKVGKEIAPTTCDAVPKNFTVDINPIIQTFCNQTACHDAGSTNGPGPLTNYTEVFNARSDIRGQVQAGLMPQNTTLTTAQKNTIICWIDNGAPNN